MFPFCGSMCKDRFGKKTLYSSHSSYVVHNYWYRIHNDGAARSGNVSSPEFNITPQNSPKIVISLVNARYSFSHTDVTFDALR